MLSGSAASRRCTALAAHDGLHGFTQHEHANGAEEGDVGQGDHQIQLPEALQDTKNPDTEGRANNTRAEQSSGEFEVDARLAPIGQNAGCGGGYNLCGDGGNGNGWRNSGEDEQRREQEAASNAEKPERNPTVPPMAKIMKTLIGSSAMGR